MKKSVIFKITVLHLVVVLISLIIVGLVFNYFAERYMENRIASDLRSEALIIADILRNDTLEAEYQLEGRMQELRKSTMKINRMGLSSQVRIILKDRMGRIGIFPADNTEELQDFLKNSFKDIESGINNERQSEFTLNINGIKNLGVTYQINLRPGSPIMGKLWLLLYIPLDQIHQLSRNMLTILVCIFPAIALIAAGLGVLSARSIAKPIIRLKTRAEQLSKRDFDSKVTIKTGDELEDLGNTINKMAAELKEYDISQKRFLQNASHELKTPLMSIQGYAEGIKDGVFDNNETALNVIIEESNRLKFLVEEIIFLSKLETAEDFYKFANESINEIIIKSLEKVDSIVKKNNIEITFKPDSDIRIFADKDKLVQVFINVLGNCLRYARNKIEVGTIKMQSGVEIYIRDDGTGFEEGETSNIFERFYKGKKGNTGLGLAITRVIVERHSGTIRAGNHPGGGAEYRISLPVSRVIT